MRAQSIIYYMCMEAEEGKAACASFTAALMRELCCFSSNIFAQPSSIERGYIWVSLYARISLQLEQMAAE